MDAPAAVEKGSDSELGLWARRAIGSLAMIVIYAVAGGHCARVFEGPMRMGATLPSDEPAMGLALSWAEAGVDATGRTATGMGVQWLIGAIAGSKKKAAG